MVYFMENPTKNWMMTGGSTILGNLHILDVYPLVMSFTVRHGIAGPNRFIDGLAYGLPIKNGWIFPWLC